MEIERSITIDAPVEHVWDILGHRFHDVGAWASMIDASEALQAKTGASGLSDRVCNTPQGVFKEQLTNFDESKRSFSYLAYEGLPGFVVEGGSTWKVEDLGSNRTEVRVRMKFDLKPIANLLMGWMLKRNMSRLAGDVVHDLKVYAETGEVSEGKRKAQVRFARKRAA